MNSFAYIPITALCCYLFLLLAFLAAKRTKVTNDFVFMLICCVLWTGGSFFMRRLYWPSPQFWYHISICGLILLAYAFFIFVRDFSSTKPRRLDLLWLSLLCAVAVVNIFTGWFLAPPEIVMQNGEPIFVYHTSLGFLALAAILLIVISRMVIIIAHFSRRDEVKRRAFTPVFAGLLALVAGHLALMLPQLAGFPVDIVSSVVFVICLFYALYRRRLFKLTLLVSKGVCYLATGILSVAIFLNLVTPLRNFIDDHIPAVGDNDVIFIAILFSFITVMIYAAMKRFVDSVFIKDEIARAQVLHAFSASVARSLEFSEIMEEIVAVIKRTLPLRKVYVCVESNDGSCYKIAHSENPLDDCRLRLDVDNPIIGVLRESGECLFMEEFRCLSAYKSMWDEEKREISQLGIECIVPLCDDGALVGMVLLTEKERSASYTYDDITFLTSVGSIGSIAVKNSRLYERARLEACTDELTGLLNRKYFLETLQREFEGRKERSLALVILNLDDFKLYNQLYGNREGDILICKVADILRATVGSNGHVARYSGKEFAIILPDYDLYGAKSMAEIIRAQVADINRDNPVLALKPVTMSGGICAIPYGASTPKELVENADMAVYQVKRSGKNAIRLSTGGTSPGDAAPPKEAHRSDVYSEYASTIYALTAAIDTKDHYTFSHSKNVAYYAAELAYACNMNEDMVEIVREAALLHDIGKIGINEQILNKPGYLTDPEYQSMKNHVENSVGIIKHLPSLDYVIPAVIGHHERYDGRGYPRGLAGEDIPILARILCVADSFDAMVSHRPYKRPYPVEHALREIEAQAGLQFDPKLAPLFVRLVREGKITPILTDIELKIVNK
ncbi:MAG TPA: HD domain-containing phosphohydrolase [Terriglobales bacterium]|nr:HD domain-containing phosphohydrolase [Terriglobales bacterium]